ncbi:TetR/AcrR family transcriptional regulator [Liberiplasma polymorphum]|uniref:TetR/AcrR family transcriptional regulator n=1 Tax=Liberiplasma polymorphum TaxID=3374570 RepID=UPI003774518D
MTAKKEVILYKVLDFLSKESDQQLTLSNIANALDMGKSTLYEYFSSKDEMIKEAILLLIEDNKNYLLNTNDIEGTSFKEAFHIHMNKSFHLAKKNQMMQNIADSVDYVSIPKNMKEEIMCKVQEMYGVSKSFFLSIIQKGVDEGIITQSQQNVRAMTIESLFLGSFLTVSNTKRPFDESEFIEDLYNSLLILLNN